MWFVICVAIGVASICSGTRAYHQGPQDEVNWQLGNVLIPLGIIVFILLVLAELASQVE